MGIGLSTLAYACACYGAVPFDSGLMPVDSAAVGTDAGSGTDAADGTDAGAGTDSGPQTDSGTGSDAADGG
jgi:hypothetical protein